VKVRLRADSIRVRLTQGEVGRLIDAGVVEDATQFGPRARLVARVVLDDDAQNPTATLDAQPEGADAGAVVVQVALPAPAARRWAASAEEVTLAAPTEDPLRVLVEKDFPCVVAREGGEDEDTFGRPGG